MSAYDIARALGKVRKSGKGWLTSCPAHDDRTPSLHLVDTADGRVLVHCFAGCSQERVIDAIKARGMRLSDDNDQPDRPHRVEPPAKPRDDATRRGAALKLWNEARPIGDTLADEYLRNRLRGLELPQCLYKGEVLRFIEYCPFGLNWHPALVALYRTIDGDQPEPSIARHCCVMAVIGSAKAGAA